MADEREVKSPAPLHLFDGFGVELEYMIVDRDTLDVKPIADRLLCDDAGRVTSELERGPVTWSNELVLHLIEFKTSGPAPSLSDLHRLFQGEVEEANRRLEPFNACLLPGAMHPWMDPEREMHLWPHEYNPIYEAYNRIFDCRGHGWANLQSTHINLPFSGDREFGALHAAIRILLPLIPALAASSPVADRRIRGSLDHRLEVYRTNSAAIPSVTGRIIPEQVFTQADYEDRILHPMYRDIAPHDPEGILQDEFLNSRGAIARFGRGSIEIRVMDIQECPLADLAIVRLVSDVLRALVQERWSSLDEMTGWTVTPLYNILRAGISNGEEACITNGSYLRLFGMKERSATAGEIWHHLFDELYGDREHDEVIGTLKVILDRGTLSSRIIKSLAEPLEAQNLLEVYRKLSHCLANGIIYE